MSCNWGAELWDQFDNLEKHTSWGIDFLERYSKFVRERADIELNYAKQIRSLSKKYHPKQNFSSSLVVQSLTMTSMMKNRYRASAPASRFTCSKVRMKGRCRWWRARSCRWWKKIKETAGPESAGTWRRKVTSQRPTSKSSWTKVLFRAAVSSNVTDRKATAHWTIHDQSMDT